MPMKHSVDEIEKTENEQRTLQYKTQHEAKKAKFPNSKLKKISQKQSKKFTIFFFFVFGLKLWTLL